MSENVVDLSVAFAMNKQAASLLRRARVIGEHADEIMAILSTLEHTEQRFLCAMIGWRIEGGMALPASDLLSKLPALNGLEFGSIQATAEKLAMAEVIDVVPVEKNEKGETVAVAFIWPALERLIELAGNDYGPRPVFTDAHGQPLR